ncbi:glycosyltransferase involved in cell wall biosynthesis [Paraburkholderia graminis]|uniref:Glycosyltransferase involved in cell wall biosynthesis n=1 Tax=Paraburkholderia graminis TaxID=60548 RepID=A0ABD5CCE7_9BURK|nr:glycosyltransferase involved in cell wall biosynthesis [Paraburkholderia graminis]
MNFAPCIVIPIYNHKDAIGATVAHLAVHGLPIFIVDDGSDEATQQVLAELAQQYVQQVSLLRLPVNGGKGAGGDGGPARRARCEVHARVADRRGRPARRQ